MNKIIIGLDLGLSTTKILLKNLTNDEILYRKVIDNQTINFDDINCNIKAIIKELNINNYEIINVYLTGFEAVRINYPVMGCSPIIRDEVECIGKGGIDLANVDRGLIVSMGTGTAFINADKEIHHVGGAALGGGSVIGMGHRLFNTNNFNEIINHSLKGTPNKTDLMIKENYAYEDDDNETLITASNLGNIPNIACSDEDIMYGYIKMVIQNICVMATMQAQIYKQKDIILIGSLTNVSYVKEEAKAVGDLFGFNFIIPELSAYATVLGTLID